MRKLSAQRSSQSQQSHGEQLGANTRVAADAAPDADIRFRRSGATLYVFALPRSAVSART